MMHYVIAKDTFFDEFDGMDSDYISIECKTKAELTTVLANVDDHRYYQLTAINRVDIVTMNGREVTKFSSPSDTCWFHENRPFKLKDSPDTVEYTSESQPELSYASEASAGVDLPANLNQFEVVSLDPGEGMMISTGICVDMQSKLMMAMVCPKSGLGTLGLRKVEVGGHGINLSNGVGIIDSDYHGEIKVGLVNNTDSVFVIHPNDYIAQMVFLPILKPKLSKVAWIKGETERGSKGFGEMTSIRNTGGSL